MNRLFLKSILVIADFDEQKLEFSRISEKFGTVSVVGTVDELRERLEQVTPDILFLKCTNLDSFSDEIITICKNKELKSVLLTDLKNGLVLDRLAREIDFFGVYPVDIGEDRLLDCAYDALSCIKNPNTGISGLAHLLKKIRENREHVIAVIALDNIDFFYAAYGFEFGDEIIAGAVDFLDDIKPTGSYLYEIRNDRYALLFSSSDINTAIDFAMMLNAAQNSEKIVAGEVEVNVSFSMGIAMGAGDELLTTGRLALKEAQTSASRSYHVYDGKTTDEILQEHNLRWIQKIKGSLERNCIEPYFQPIYNNKTKTIEKYEVLARIVDEDEVFSPMEFMGSAKKAGLMPNVSYMIITKSFSYFANNNSEFSINISEDDLRTNRLIDFLKNRCDNFKIDPKRVCVEILESIGSTKNDSIMNQIKGLKEIGFRIAIDDFGTESSNFSRVFDLEADYIKIDGSFIKSIDTDKKSYKIAKSITTFAKSIGALTIAEYVHSQSVYDTVLELEIDYSQGYFFGKPLPNII